MLEDTNSLDGAQVLVNRLGLTMTIVVDWDVKQQIKQTKKLTRFTRALNFTYKCPVDSSYSLDRSISD